VYLDNYNGAHGTGSVLERTRPLLDELKRLRSAPKTQAYDLLEGDRDKLAQEVLRLKGELETARTASNAVCIALDNALPGRSMVQPLTEGVRVLAASRDHASAMVVELTQDVDAAKRKARGLEDEVARLRTDMSQLHPRAAIGNKFVDAIRSATIAGSAGPDMAGRTVTGLPPANYAFDLSKEEDRRKAFAAGVKLQWKSVATGVWINTEEAHLHDATRPYEWRIAP
jgi:hypothetical protein